MIPTIVSPTQSTTKLLGKYLSNITGKYDNKELQIKAILSTACIPWTFLSVYVKVKQVLSWEITLQVKEFVVTE